MSSLIGPTRDIYRISSLIGPTAAKRPNLSSLVGPTAAIYRISSLIAPTAATCRISSLICPTAAWSHRGGSESCFFFFFAHFYFPASGQAVVTGVIPSPPRFLPSIFIAHRVQQSRCSSIFHRTLYLPPTMNLTFLTLNNPSSSPRQNASKPDHASIPLAPSAKTNLPGHMYVCVGRLTAWLQDCM